MDAGITVLTRGDFVNFDVIATCSSCPQFQKLIRGRVDLTARMVLDKIEESCPSVKGTEQIVLINGFHMRDKDFDIPFSKMWEEGCTPGRISIHRRDIGVISEENMRKLREFRDFLNVLLGE